MNSTEYMKISTNASSIMKGLFAIFVVCFHLYSPLGGGGGSRIPYILCRIGMFGFLFLSGYGSFCSYQLKGLDGFWSRKIEKIYVPALFANILGAAVAILGFRLSFDRATLFENIFRFSPDSIFNRFLWYLHYLFFWHLFFWLIYSFIKNKKARVLSWVVVGLMMWFVTPEVYSGETQIITALPLLWEFYMRN